MNKKETKYNTSIAKNVEKGNKNHSKKPITDLSAILIQNENKDLSNIQMEDITSPMVIKDDNKDDKSPKQVRDASPLA